MKKAFGTGVPVLTSIRPRSTMVRSDGGIFVCPACGPPRQVRSWKPSATEGNVPKKMSSSRRTYSRSFGVSGQGVCFVRVAMVGSICQPGWLQHDRTRGIRDRLSGVLRSNAGLIDEYQRIDNRSFAAAANKVPINAAPADAASQ